MDLPTLGLNRLTKLARKFCDNSVVSCYSSRTTLFAPCFFLLSVLLTSSEAELLKGYIPILSINQTSDSKIILEQLDSSGSITTVVACKKRKKKKKKKKKKTMYRSMVTKSRNNIRTLCKVCTLSSSISGLG
jgi:hypothetical protein